MNNCRTAPSKIRRCARTRPARRFGRWSWQRGHSSVSWWAEQRRGRKVRKGRRGFTDLGVLCSLCVLVTSFAACGYSLAGRGSFLPAHITTIGVPTFTNRTTLFNLETQLTQQVRSEFIGRGRYRILPDAGAEVDALLTGEITAVTISPASFSTQQLASRYVITMAARVQLR